MKKMNFLKSLFVLAISLTLVQCTSGDPIPGPAGATGTAGTNGTNGLNGADGGNVCISCHNVDYKVVQPATFATSDHAIGATLAARAGACLNCHSDAGYKGAVATGNITVAIAGLIAADAGKINCTTCHAGGHASAAAAISGKDAALRSAGFYILNQKTAAGADVIIDYKNNSNSCVHCHQPRRTDVTGLAPNALGMVSIATSTGPHYGVGSAMLEGIFASEVAGTVAYPAKGTAVHRTGASCTQCHMGKAKDGKGNHTMKPVLDNCKTCHTGAGVVDYNINGGQTKIKNLMLELAEEMVRLRPTDFRIANYTGSKPFVSPNVFTDPAFSPNQLTIIAPTKSYAATDASLMRIAKGYWNWRYVYQDHSYGLHNPKYAEALLRNTIANLKLLP